MGRAGALAALAGLLLFSAGCTGVAYTEGPPGVYYDYYYYPDWDVYYYPAGGVFYWNEGGHWYSGRHLPYHYDFHGEQHENLRLRSRQPWTEHHEYHPESHPVSPAPQHGEFEHGPEHH